MRAIVDKLAATAPTSSKSSPRKASATAARDDVAGTDGRDLRRSEETTSSRCRARARPESVRRSVMAGCTSIEHGALIGQPELDLMAEHGTYFDPNIDLVFRNYFENKSHYLRHRKLH